MARLPPSRVGPPVASTTTNAAHAHDEQPSGFAANWRSWLLAVLLIAGVVVAVLHWGDVKKFAALVAHAKPLWLVAAQHLVGADVAHFADRSAHRPLFVGADLDTPPQLLQMNADHYAPPCATRWALLRLT